MAKVKYSWEDPLALADILYSWKAAFEKEGDLRTFEWWLNTQDYFEESPAAYIMKDGLVACFYAISPRIILTPSGDRLKAGLMNIGFTHPKFQGKGYYLKLNNEMHQKLKTNGYACIFGFANHNSHYSYRKYLEWNDLGILTNFRLDINKQKKYAKNLTYSMSEDLSPDACLLETLSECYVTGSNYRVERTAGFLNWRLLKSPTRNYFFLKVYEESRVQCYAVYKLYNMNQVDIMELFYPCSRDANDPIVIMSIIKHFESMGIGSINIWSNLYSNEHLLLEKIGFKEERYSTYFGVINFSESLAIADIRNWHYRFLDSDVY